MSFNEKGNYTLVYRLNYALVYRLRKGYNQRKIDVG